MDEQQPLGSSTDSTADATALLLDFVSNRDVPCPRCAYNLRNLTRPVCPECGNPLHLRIGTTRVQLAPFLLAAAPGIFSGIAAALFSGAAIYSLLVRGRINKPPTPMWFALAFGWISAFAVATLYLLRARFLRQQTLNQWIWAASMWIAHVLAFGALVYFMA